MHAEDRVKAPTGRRISESLVSHTVILDSKTQADIHKHYTFKRVLGHGQFGTVREAISRRLENAQSVAIKSIPKAKIVKEVHVLRRELEIIRLADHPNIVKHYETYEDDKYLHLVMELCTGGDILDRLLQKGTLTEVEVANIMKTLLLAVNHLHSLSIIHRDLKPENFLYGSPESDSEIKIIDFGMSNKLEPGFRQLHSMVGTPYYLAPEVLSGTYGKECDVWSLGVVMYVFLSGQQPFQGQELNQVFQRIVQADFSFEGPEWDPVSTSAKSLISLMIKANPHHRITIDQALKHPWLSSNTQSEDNFIQPRVLHSLKRFKAPKKLQQEAMKVVVKNLSMDEIRDLRNAFIMIDREKTGFITAADLEVAMFSAGYVIASDEIKSNFSRRNRIEYRLPAARQN